MKLMIDVPEPLLVEIDSLENGSHIDRNELVLEALRYYLVERKRTVTIEQMKKGYAEMSEINLSLTDELLPLDVEALNLIDTLAE
jgi:CopG family transcriptional regulator/antitoxin EndoAI